MKDSAKHASWRSRLYGAGGGHRHGKIRPHRLKKIAATLASTGTPSFFVHPGEASHGDLGTITRGDVVLALSNSGNTAEVVTLLPLLKRLAVPTYQYDGQSAVCSGTGGRYPSLCGRRSLPLGLAPTSSTTSSPRDG